MVTPKTSGLVQFKPEIMKVKLAVSLLRLLTIAWLTVTRVACSLTCKVSLVQMDLLHWLILKPIREFFISYSCINILTWIVYSTWPVGHFDGGITQIDRFLREHECNLICQSLGLDIGLQRKGLHCEWFVPYSCSGYKVTHSSQWPQIHLSCNIC